MCVEYVRKLFAQLRDQHSLIAARSSNAAILAVLLRASMGNLGVATTIAPTEGAMHLERKYRRDWKSDRREAANRTRWAS